MFLVGLTGGIASGKSSVASILKNLNCEVIDADEIARQGTSIVCGCLYLLYMYVVMFTSVETFSVHFPHIVE